MKRKINRILSLLVILALVVLMVPATAFAASDTTDSIDSVLERINAKYGTEIRRFTPEELEQRGIEAKAVPTLTKEQLVNLEKEMSRIAESEIPQFELANQKALEEAKKNGLSLDDLKERYENALSEKSKSAQDPSAIATLVTASAPINYATALADAYIIEDGFGNLRWGSVPYSYCQTNIYQSTWFLSQYPYSSVVDLGRTIYWTGYGDYGSYINGVEYYLYSGTQYAYMYVGNYT